MTIPALAAAAQSAAPGPYVQLFDIDATVLGGGVHHITPRAGADQPLRWRGCDYQPVDFESEGWEWTGRGALPTPKIRVSNVGRAFGALVTTYGDLLGCTVRRWRTFARFLDGSPEADPDGHFPVDVYRIERKSVHDKAHIEWELSAALDQEGRVLPGRVVLRDTCTHRYRVWTDGGWNYSRATCPYAGDAAFDSRGAVADPPHDVCGKRIKDCKARFGATAALPTRAFPGVARTRVS